MRLVALLFFLATILATCHGSDHGPRFRIFPLRMKTDLVVSNYIREISCPSWRLAVEAHNIVDWKTVPQECGGYVENYLVHSWRYFEDSIRVTQAAYLYAKNLNLRGDGKDVWVFDIDETVLSNLQFYADYGFGVKPFNATGFVEWVHRGIAPAVQASLILYENLMHLGIKIVFLTGRPKKKFKKITKKNLKYAGYHTWKKLILRHPKYENSTAVTYKSAMRKKLEDKKGFRIVGNMGDQWSDILGTNTGDRTFKLPNPMYYNS